MEIILSSNCESFTGSLGRGFGYFIVRRKNGFFSVRSKHSVPPDGHWNFIVSCAEIAHMGLHFSNIKVGWSEVRDALWEANHFIAADAVFRNADRQIKLNYDADNILNLKTTFGL